MKKILTIGLFSLMLGVGFGQYDTGDSYELDNYENVELIDQTLQDIWLDFSWIFFDFMASMQDIFVENHALYLAEYCTLNDNIFEDPLDCWEYNDTILILDAVLEDVFPEDEWEVEMDIAMEAEWSVDEMEKIMGEITELREWPEQLSIMLKQYMDQQPSMSDQKTFMFGYILFSLDSMVDVFEYFESFYREIIELLHEEQALT